MTKENLAYFNNLDYDATKKNVENFFSRYRAYKLKKDTINKRDKLSSSFDNLGIYSGYISDPVGVKVEMLERYTKFIDLVDEIYKLNKSCLTKDENIIYQKYLATRNNEKTLLDYLNISSKSGLYNRKKSCIEKVAIWFDLEVYKE